MVKETQKEEKTLYACEICGFRYLEEKTAQECQNYCENHSSCSMEITKKAVERGN